MDTISRRILKILEGIDGRVSMQNYNMQRVIYLSNTLVTTIFGSGAQFDEFTGNPPSATQDMFLL